MCRNGFCPLIAGHLLDVNAKGGVSEEQAANMARIMADAVELLPKLTTGIDVNVIFNDIKRIRGTSLLARPLLWHLQWLKICLQRVKSSLYCFGLLLALHAVRHCADTFWLLCSTRMQLPYSTCWTSTWYMAGLWTPR